MSKVAPAEDYKNGNGDTHSSTTTSPAQSMTSCTSSVERNSEGREEHRPRRPSEELRVARKSRRSSQMLHELTVGSLTAGAACDGPCQKQNIHDTFNIRSWMQRGALGLKEGARNRPRYERL